MSPNELDRIAHDLIAEKITAGEIVHMHWAVQELINSQGEIAGGAVPFFSLCAREHVYRIVKKAVSKYGDATVDHEQLTLDGFDHLQQAYTVARDEERQLVPVHLLSDDELTDRAAEFRKQAGGLIRHAQEIEKYVADRSGVIALNE